MKRFQTRLLAAGLCLAGLGSDTVWADDWPQWRGPQRNGISREKGLLQEWPKEGPKLAWKIHDLGSGYSTPSVVGNRIYVLSNEGLENESVLALGAGTGERIWATRIGNVGNPKQQPNYPAARSTPTVEGEVLYALGSDGDLVCLETATGKFRWQKNLRTDFGGQPGEWAYAESPLIDGEVLVCTPGGSNATLVALRKKDAEVVWKCAVPGGEQAAYASAVAAEIEGVKQYVQFLQKGVVGVEAKTGRLLWRYDRTAKGSPANIPTPLVADGCVYTASGRSGGALIKPKKGDGSFEVEEVYYSQKLPTILGGTVKLGDYFYGTTTRALQCVEFRTGEQKWEDASVGAASVCYADGRLYLHGENGEVLLIEATPEAYRERGRFLPPDQPSRGSSKAWAHPVVANGRLYIRDFAMLWCYIVAAQP